MCNQTDGLVLTTFTGESAVQRIDHREDFSKDKEMAMSPRTTVPLVVDEPGTFTVQGLCRAMNEDVDSQKGLLAVISETLNDIVRQNDAAQMTTTLVTFLGPRILLSASDYVKRIAKYSGASASGFLVGLIYLERLKQREPSLCLTSKTLQRLLLVAVMEASKFIEDSYLTNKRWAQIGGMELGELNSLELEFLFRVGFSLTVHREEYDWHASCLLQNPPPHPAAAPWGEAPPPQHKAHRPAGDSESAAAPARLSDCAAAPLSCRTCGPAAAASICIQEGKAAPAPGECAGGPRLNAEWASKPHTPCGPGPAQQAPSRLVRLHYV